MNSRWKACKIGLVNFWYYDEQEFYFQDGRMLLRGANGSGKSVTMQSFIPLLLDGNMRPERLDPFGSRARKMENYLLEENDAREERTGYLYMEFKRQDSGTYQTIGIGLRARKNKKMDTWYFCISDGRRIGKDFLLYRESGEKIVYSRRELENRMGTGGRVFDSQKEYMECVNRQIFGFETMDEYREMIELLIQLRTPKLSKDFKPSIINDILSNSLQPLSEEELADKVVRMFQGTFGNKTQADLFGDVQGAYHENRGFLLEYSLTLEILFPPSEDGETGRVSMKRLDPAARYRGAKINMKNRKVYEKLMKGFLGKYQSLGRVGDSRAALGSQEGGQEALARVERKNERFFRAGLVKDDISNYTVAWGIHCRKKDGRLHEGIEGYAREPVHISLWTMGEIAEAFVDNGDGAGAVRVVENPAVFAALAGNARGEAVVCTNGQPRLTSLMLLDLLSRSGCILFYAGDFDPEGLKIADNLKRRYRKGMRFWHYEIEDYYKARSDVELPEIAEVLKRERRAGYQERLIEAYLKD